MKPATTTDARRDIRTVIYSLFNDGTREMGFLPIGTQFTNQWDKKRTVTGHVSELMDFTPDCPPWG